MVVLNPLLPWARRISMVVLRSLEALDPEKSSRGEEGLQILLGQGHLPHVDVLCLCGGQASRFARQKKKLAFDGHWTRLRLS